MNGAGFNFLEGMMRTGASVARNYFEAKVAVAEASNERDLHRAQMRLAEARNRLLAQKNENDKYLGQMQIASQERMHDAAQETARFQIVTDGGGEMYKVDKTTGAATKIAQVEAQSRENVAQVGADAATSVAATRAGADVTTAQVGADAATSVAATRAGADVTTAQVGADAATSVAATRAGALLKAAEIEAEAARNVAEFGADARLGKLDAMFAARVQQGLGGKAPVSPEAARYFMSVRSAVKQSEPYKLLNSSQLAVHRAIELYADGATAADDIALMNIFQRAIDPGVSVREGDVELQRSTMSLIGQLDLMRQRFNESVGLTAELRVNLLNTLVNLANTDYRILMPRVERTVNSDITMNSELSQAGYDARDMFYVAPQSFAKVTVTDEKTGALGLQAGVPDENPIPSSGENPIPSSGGQVASNSLGDGRLERKVASNMLAQDAAPGENGGKANGLSLQRKFVARSKEYLEQGHSVEKILAALKTKLDKSGASVGEKERMDIYNAVGEQLRSGQVQAGTEERSTEPPFGSKQQLAEGTDKRRGPAFVEGRRLGEAILQSNPNASRGWLRGHLRLKIDWAKANVVPAKRRAIIEDILDSLLPKKGEEKQ